MNEQLRENETKRRTLEDQIDEQNETLTKLTAQEQYFNKQLQESESNKQSEVDNAKKMRDALELQMETHRDQHQKQLTELRKEIDVKQERIDSITEYELILIKFSDLLTDLLFKLLIYLLLCL